ncbi:MAG: DUF2184 domain-containing protein [Cyanobacteria bacterium SBC]|nr:DUF2184 domain-containing protein [Cyanobacteria bacterium SBC]
MAPQASIARKRYLQQKLDRLLERRHRTLVYENGEAIPTLADLQAGVSEIVQEQIEQTGDAKVISEQAFDIPLADANLTEVSYPVIVIASGFSYTLIEMQKIERAASNGSRFRVNDKRGEAAARAIAEKVNRYTAYGSSQYNFPGFLNHPDVDVEDSSTDIFDSNTTDDEVYDFVKDRVYDIAKRTELIEQPTTLRVSIDVHARLTDPRANSASDTTVKNLLLENLREMGLREIVPDTHLNSDRLEQYGVHAAGTHKDRMVLYPKFPEVVERHVEPLQMAPEEYRNMRYIFPAYACVSPALINFPDAMYYIDLPKKSA